MKFRLGSSYFSGVLMFGAALSGAGVASANETQTYTYDARGRLVVVKSTGTVNNNQTRSYCYDKAGNRVEFDANSTGVPDTCVKTGALGS